MGRLIIYVCERRVGKVVGLFVIKEMYCLLSWEFTLCYAFSQDKVKSLCFFLAQGFLVLLAIAGF